MPLAFDQQAFMEAISAATAIIARASVVVATLARTSATEGQGGTSNLQGFQVHHPPPYMRGGDSMVRTTLAIEREVDDTLSIQDMGVKAKRRRINLPLALGRRTRLLLCTDLKDRVVQKRASSQLGQMTCYHCHQPRHMRRDCQRRQGS